jgi:hypothetical protein
MSGRRGPDPEQRVSHIRDDEANLSRPEFLDDVVAANVTHPDGTHTASGVPVLRQQQTSYKSVSGVHGICSFVAGAGPLNVPMHRQRCEGELAGSRDGFSRVE